MGIVTFFDGDRSLGTGLLSGGQTSITTSALTPGSHTITASYGGDDVFAGSKSGKLVQLVKQTTMVTIVSSANPSALKQPVAFIATVSPASGVVRPTGKVTFKDGSRTLGTVKLSGNGTATLNVTSLGVGVHTITASYLGDKNFVVGSATWTQTVVPIVLQAKAVAPGSSATAPATGTIINRNMHLSRSSAGASDQGSAVDAAILSLLKTSVSAVRIGPAVADRLLD